MSPATLTRRATPAREYRVHTRKPHTAFAAARLQRAIGRFAGTDGARRSSIAVDVDGGCLVLVVGVRGAALRARDRVEAIFETVWYDAFGDRGGGHRTTVID